ncbi:hypothetical protein LTR28_008492 [Elasticomyces elasticus]|nr:hypothetical protein LTR28_008492 [Elasticomyces elasticus]
MPAPQPSGLPFLKQVRPTELLSLKALQPQDLPFLKQLRPAELLSLKALQPQDLPFLKQLRPVELLSLKALHPQDLPFLKQLRPAELLSLKAPQPQDLPFLKQLRPTGLLSLKALQPPDLPFLKQLRPAELLSLKALQLPDLPLVKQLRPTELPSLKQPWPLEHTVEGRAAAARQGAGIIECDITFTKDQELVCRHSQCDLHTSTNILLIPELAAKCNQTFVPAANGKPASAQCCTSDITLAEFKTLCGKQDGFNASATNVQDYQNGTPNWRTDLYSTCGTVTSHKDYIQEINRFGLSYTPETKAPLVQMPFQGNFTQDMYVQKAVNEYKEAGIHPSRVWFQSFLLRDVLYWIKNEPEFAKQAMYLDDRVETDAGYKAAVAAMQDIANQGVKLIAPAFPYLLAVDNSTKKIVPSDYAIAAQKAGLKFITWSFERSGPLAKVAKAKDYYYSTILDVIKTDGQMYEVLDVLAQQVKIVGFFSDWPATITYYANCMGLKGGFADADRN